MAKVTVTVKDELMQEAIACTKKAYPRVPAAEVIVEEALKALIKRMDGLPELKERIRNSPRKWGWDDPPTAEPEEQVSDFNSVSLH
ncbi:MAG: type II toxin-antitoxin system VapB family antitoxin [Planctomycetaceae bacterium]|jgi:hypothetical protein|nr:type II toxin-antitoxin system VapB family antitoxin [Planctomycetaceae bacterium]